MMEYGCIGEHLAHSFSAEIHRRLFGYAYELQEVAPDALEGFLRAKAFRGINVTIPYKQAVLPLLDEVDEVARTIGAVNTVVNQEGRLYGYNTDFGGMSGLLTGNGMVLSGREVLILGTGGTSHTALAVARSLGASSVTRVSRTGRDGAITYEQAAAFHAGAQVLLNTTPCGMYPAIGIMPVNLSDFPRLECVADAVYNPLNSALIVAARARGIRAAGGLSMLVRQAVLAARHFTGRTVSEDEIERFTCRLYREKENVVLIGMPGSGKTTLGRLLAQRIGREFVDCDKELVRRAGRDIPTLFREEGEAGFRKREAEVIADLARRQGCVIATGGGAVLNSINMDLLKENGRLFFLDRPLSSLPATADRPLSSDREALARRYRERHERYLAAADCRIDCGGTLADNLQHLKEAYES